MNLTLLVTFWLIVLARITDVSLDTIRTASIIQGRRVFAAVLGFFEAVVYICAAPKANKRRRSWPFPLERLAFFKRGVS